MSIATAKVTLWEGNKVIQHESSWERKEKLNPTSKAACDMRAAEGVWPEHLHNEGWTGANAADDNTQMA